jgi:hypothetical protein
MPDAALDAVLARAAAGLPVPDADRFAAAVGQRLHADEAPKRGRDVAPPWRRPLWVAVAVAVVIALVIAAVPASRSAVADWLSIGGVRVQTAPSSRASSPAPTVDELAGLDLGSPVSLEEAARSVDFAIAQPRAPGYERPDAVYVRAQPAGGMVSFVYGPTAQRPASPVAPVGVLLSEFRATVNPAVFKKLVGSGTNVEFVTVGSEPGYWISGAPHELLYTDEHGHAVSDTARLAANTLVWTSGGITCRLESALTRADAISLAESIG